jgi:glycosyltransferase involved in cell wall biosynthesis
MLKSNNNSSNKLIEINLNEEYKYIEQFLYLILNNTLINKDKIFHKIKNPKISIVIPTFNAEGYIQKSILSIQNQNFKDIEIIIVDDYSKDKTIYLIKELMKKDERIKLIRNDKNKGTLYTKTKGILNAKGKYVMILDQDDLYTQKDVFSTLYSYIENKNLDIIGFSSIFSVNNLKDINKRTKQIIHYFETPILYQPDISKRMYNFNKSGKPNRVNSVIWNYIYKTELFIYIIKKIDDKFMNTKMVCHEDFLLFFLLSRKADTLKYIKRIFYINIRWKKGTNNKIKYSSEEKSKQEKNFKCLSYINYIEFLLMNTNNTFNDKSIASYEFNNWYFNNKCKYNKFIEERGKYVCKLFLENQYIENKEKNKIRKYLKETIINLI